MSPRKLFALINVHLELLRKQNGVDEEESYKASRKPTNQVVDGYIDQIKGW